jgi:hypothetical protein
MSNVDVESGFPMIAKKNTVLRLAFLGALVLGSLSAGCQSAEDDLASGSGSALVDDSYTSFIELKQNGETSRDWRLPEAKSKVDFWHVGWVIPTASNQADIGDLDGQGSPKFVVATGYDAQRTELVDVVIPTLAQGQGVAGRIRRRDTSTTYDFQNDESGLAEDVATIVLLVADAKSATGATAGAECGGSTPSLGYQSNVSRGSFGACAYEEPNGALPKKTDVLYLLLSATLDVVEQKLQRDNAMQRCSAPPLTDEQLQKGQYNSTTTYDPSATSSTESCANMVVDYDAVAPARSTTSNLSKSVELGPCAAGKKIGDKCTVGGETGQCGRGAAERPDEVLCWQLN